MSSLRRIGRIGAGWPLLRLVVRTLRTLDARLAEQNALLQRLADAFAPVPPAVSADSGDLRTLTAADRAARQAEAIEALSHFDPIEAAMAETFVIRVRDQQGREPSDEEILTYLAEQKSYALQVALHQRTGRGGKGR